MIKPIHSESIDQLRNAYDRFKWLRWFFPGNIAAAMEGLPPIAPAGQLAPYNAQDAIAIIKAVKESNWLSRLLFKCLRTFKASPLFSDYDNNVSLNTGGYVNFFWAGNEPTNKQIKALQRWSDHCKGTEFRVNLCLTHAIIEKLTKQKRLTYEGPDHYILKPQGILITNMDRLLLNYATRYPKTLSYYEKQIQHKNYAFACDVTKIVIANEYPGFYVDLDASPGERLPASLDELYAILDDIGFHPDRTDLYTKLIKTKFDFVVEAGMLLTLQPGRLYGLLDKIEQYYVTHQEALNQDLRDFDLHKRLPRVTELNKSFFMNNMDFEYLRAFLNKDSLAYSQHNYDEKVDGSSNGIYVVERFNSLIQVYLQITLNHFVKQLPPKYKEKYQGAIGKYFLFDQDALDLYNWGNPGYSRLNELKDAVAQVESRRLAFFEKTGKVRQGKSLIKALDFAKIFDGLLQFPQIKKPGAMHRQEIVTKMETFKDKYATKYYVSAKELTEELQNLETLVLFLEERYPGFHEYYKELTNATPFMNPVTAVPLTI